MHAAKALPRHLPTFCPFFPLGTRHSGVVRSPFPPGTLSSLQLDSFHAATSGWGNSTHNLHHNSSSEMPRRPRKTVAESDHSLDETSLPTPRVTRSQTAASARGIDASLRPHVVHSGKAEAEKKTNKPPRDVLLKPGAILPDLSPEKAGKQT